MDRNIVAKLISWKQRKTGRMPLILHGARQVGKTYTITNFGKEHYKNTVYVNFEKTMEVHDFFSGDLTPAKIIRLLENRGNTKILPEETLLFFDEIQCCERALTALKYFAEDAPEYHVIAAGSLLGVAINRDRFSFPVGKVFMETMYPMDFEEFLMANEEKLLLEMIYERYREMAPMSEVWHNKAMGLHRMYTLTGGMPAVVKHFVESGGQTAGVSELQELISSSYIRDMSKYADRAEAVKIIACFESIPAQLAKDNKKFQYKVVKKGGNASMFGDSLEWLNSSGVVLKCQKTAGLMPPAVHADQSNFKLYMGDVGLLAHKNGLTMENLLSVDRLFAGGLAENYVAGQLSARGYKLFYWESENRAEIDFLLQKDGEIIPVEVKANLHSKSKSLDVFRKKTNPEFSIRISARNFGFNNGIKSVPLYAVYLI